MNAFVL